MKRFFASCWPSTAAGRESYPVRLLSVVMAVLAVFGPQLLFLAVTALSGDLVFVQNRASDGERLLTLVAVTVCVGAAALSCIYTWIDRKNRATARRVLLIAAASTTLSVIGIGAGFLVAGLVAVSGIFFLMSLPILLLAIWNARTAAEGVLADGQVVN